MVRTATRRAAGAALDAVRGLTGGYTLRLFYVAVLGMALVGSAQGAETWLRWDFRPALAAVALYELGGVAVSVFGDRRRQLGERALIARLIGAAFAAGAVAINFLGHMHDGRLTGTSWFFGGLSAAGYAIYLLDSGAKRRDALRRLGKLAEPPPAYGVYQWLRHPALTSRARALAVANAEVRLVERITSREAGGPDQPTTPLLGRAASLAAAVAAVAAERQTRAIRGALRRRIAAGVDPQMAEIAVHTYDLSRVARGIADSADYSALTGLLTAELTPGRIAAGVTANRRRSLFGRRPETAETAPAALETAPTLALPAVSTTPAWRGAAPAGTELIKVWCKIRGRVPANPALEDWPTPDTDMTPDPDPTDPVNALPPAEPARVAQVALVPPVPEVAAHLLPHLDRVMAAHPDWATAITMPGKHPDALSTTKIKAAIGRNGQQLAYDLRTALLTLRGHPGAEAYVREAVRPATAAA